MRFCPLIFFHNLVRYRSVEVGLTVNSNVFSRDPFEWLDSI